jgi:indole-3-glycerol phosphate synthase
MNILDQLAEYSRLRVAEDKKKISLDEIKNIAIQTKNEKLCDFAFEKALKKDDLSFICECKKASPSKGLIEPDFRYLEIAREYEAAGADCISVLTEPKWFLGSDKYLKEITKTVSIPCIRKDFTVDEYQIYQAKTLGAAAVLLICTILSEVQLGEYIKICDSLGISALVEIHNEKEAGMAVRAGARIIGVNNRNLKDFTVDTANSKKLRDLIPDDIIFVSESGVKSTDDIRAIREIGADAVLIGETLMRADDKKAKLDELRLSFLLKELQEKLHSGLVLSHRP